MARGRMSNSGCEELRRRGVESMRAGEFDEALQLFDKALAIAEDEHARELITINKASVLITLEKTGPEVQSLAQVVMRRRNLRHVYLAAYWLQYKNRLEGDLQRAVFYGQLALRTAEEANEPTWRRPVLIELGTNYEMDSQIPRAIECLQEAIAITEESMDKGERDVSMGYALENLGYCRLLEEKYDEGLALVHRSLNHIHDRHALAEAYVDLCYGYLGKGELERAQSYGKKALDLAEEERQVRNAHYLLVEIAHQQHDTKTAEFHFDELARFYPGFRHLKDVLFAIDLRRMVNWKL